MARFHYFWWLIFHCISIPHLLYLFICRQTSGLFPYFGYFGHRCSKHWGTRASLSHYVYILWGKYLEVQLLDCRAVLFLTFWGTSILFSRVTAPVFLSTNSVNKECSLKSDGCKVLSHCSFDLHIPEHLFLCLLVIWMLSLEKCFFVSFMYFGY